MSGTEIPTPTSNGNADYFLWQLADSAFPTGSFAHSNGLEAALQQGHIKSSADVANFITQCLHQTANSLLPFLATAYDHSDQIIDLDHHLDATLSNHVANRASRAQGQALLATTEKVLAHPRITAHRKLVLAQNLPAHLPIILALIASAANVPREKAIRLFLFTTMRSTLSAAVRLNAVGPIEAQQIQLRLTPTLESLAQSHANLTPESAAQTNPLLDLLQSTQDRLYSRLFQS